MAFGDILGKSPLVEYLDEHFDSLVFLCVLEDLNCVDAFVLVLLEILQLFGEVCEKLLLVAVFGQIDVFEFGEAVFAEPGQTVLLSKRSLFLSLALEDPELVVFLHIFLLFGVVPAIGSQQIAHVFTISDAFADLVAFLRDHAVLFLGQSSIDA